MLDKALTCELKVYNTKWARFIKTVAATPNKAAKAETINEPKQIFIVLTLLIDIF